MKLTNVKHKLGIETVNDTGVWIRSTRTLRHLIGVLGMLLPLLLMIFNSKCDNPIESISHYYYTTSGTFFVVILSLVAIFLIIYTKDFFLSSIAGVCALFVVFFPTSQLTADCSIVILEGSSLREGFHYASAVVFLVILAIMTLFKFTKPDTEEQQQEITEVPYKNLYVICGVVMIVALAVMGLRFLSNYVSALNAFAGFYDANTLTFWMETVALEAFGLAWLVKGRFSLGENR